MGAASFVKINEEARRNYVEPKAPEPTELMPESATIRVLDVSKVDPDLGAKKEGDEVEVSFSQADTLVRLGHAEFVVGREGAVDPEREALAQEALALGVKEPNKDKPAPISVLRKWKNERLAKAIEDRKVEVAKAQP